MISGNILDIGDLILWSYLYEPEKQYTSIVINITKDYNFSNLIEVLLFNEVKILPCSMLLYKRI